MIPRIWKAKLKTPQKRRRYSWRKFWERFVSGIIIFLMASVLVYEVANVAFGNMHMVQGCVEEITHKYRRKSSRLTIVVNGETYAVNKMARAERFQYVDELANALMTEVCLGEMVVLHVHEGAFHGRDVHGLSCNGIDYLDFELGLRDNERFVLIFSVVAAICAGIGIACEVQAVKIWKCILKRRRRQRFRKIG